MQRLFYRQIDYKSTGGDFGLDAFLILGRTWGGPLFFVQAKNSSFDRGKCTSDLARLSDALQEWFGRHVDKFRSVIPVVAMNTVLTLELKEKAFHACNAGAGFHILDAVDVIHAETMTPGPTPDHHALVVI